MRLLFIVLIIVAVYIFMRRLSAAHSSTPSAEHYRVAHGQTIEGDPSSVKSASTDDQSGDSAYEITRYYFAHTDAAQGPADADVFYDELFIDLVNSNTGDKFQNRMFVCTPRGLTEEMVKEQWDSVVGTELLIVRRYNIDHILVGARHHLEEIYESTLKVAPGNRGGHDYVG
jgi:hypothetical protein